MSISFIFWEANYDCFYIHCKSKAFLAGLFWLPCIVCSDPFFKFDQRSACTCFLSYMQHWERETKGGGPFSLFSSFFLFFFLSFFFYFSSLSLAWILFMHKFLIHCFYTTILCLSFYIYLSSLPFSLCPFSFSPYLPLFFLSRCMSVANARPSKEGLSFQPSKLSKSKKIAFRGSIFRQDCFHLNPEI